MRNPIDLFKGSLAIMQDNFSLFIGILLLPILVSLIVSLFAPSEATGVIDTTEWVLYTVLMLISGVVNILMSVALILAIDNRSLTVKEAYKGAASFFWRYLGLTIVMMVILFIGFILFIIPGIILSIWFAFSTFILILERSAIKEALSRSREYVRGRWWGVFGRVVVMTLILVVLTIVVSGISAFIPSDVVTEVIIAGFSLFLAPLGVGYMYLMYQDISGHAQAPAVSEVAGQV